MATRRATIALLALFLSGCTHIKLQRATVRQGSTLTDLQYQQILDNIAMFVSNPEAMPWQVKLTSGLVQVADQRAGGLTVDSLHQTQLSPTLSGQRAVVEQWNVNPVVERDDLESLRLAYLKAAFPFDANGQTKEAILDKICETSVTQRVPLNRKVLRAVTNSLIHRNKGNDDEIRRLKTTYELILTCYCKIEEYRARPIPTEDQWQNPAEDTTSTERDRQPSPSGLSRNKDGVRQSRNVSEESGAFQVQRLEQREVQSEPLLRGPALFDRKSAVSVR
jgi:hypothetical protein